MDGLMSIYLFTPGRDSHLSTFSSADTAATRRVGAAVLCGVFEWGDDVVKQEVLPFNLGCLPLAAGQHISPSARYATWV